MRNKLKGGNIEVGNRRKNKNESEEQRLIIEL